MPRYIGQRDTFRCCPIAIFNALRWSGQCIKYEYLKRIVRHCRCTYEDKVFRYNLDRSLIVYGKRRFEVRIRYRPSISSIEEHLRQPECAVIINDLRTENGMEKGHCYLVTKVTDSGKSFTVVNLYKGEAVRMIRRSTFKHSIRPRKHEDGAIYPVAWFLTMNRY